MKLIATIVDLLLRVAAVVSLGIFVLVYVMVGFMAGPIGIIFIVVPSLALGGWILICACMPDTIASKFIGAPTLRFLLMKIPVYAIAAAGIYWKGNNLLFEHRLNGPRSVQVQRGDPQYPESNPNPTRMLTVTGTLPQSLPVKDLIAVYSANAPSENSSSAACTRFDEFAPLRNQVWPLVFVQHVPMARTRDSYRASIVIDRFKLGLCGWHLKEVNYFLSVKGYRYSEYFSGRNFFPHIEVLASSQSPDQPLLYRGPMDVLCWTVSDQNVRPFYPERCTDIEGALKFRRYAETEMSAVERDSGGITHVFPESSSIEFNFHDLDAVSPQETEVRGSPIPETAIRENPVAASKAASESESATTISIGDSLDGAQKALHIADSPMATHSSTAADARSLFSSNQGIRVFFDSANKVYEVRIDAPFAGQLGGTRINETREDVEKTLGPPAKDLSRSAAKLTRSFIYNIDAQTSARYDFDVGDKVKTIYLLSGTLQTAPGGP